MLKKELLVRHPENPILTFKDLSYNVNAIYNPGAVKYKKEYILVPRVEDGRRDNKLHIARSKDGVHFIIDNEPIPIPPDDETDIWEYHRYDPRVTYLEGEYYITYCAQNFGEIVRIGCIKTKDFKHYERLPFFTPPWNRNCALFPEKINGYYARVERPMHGNQAINMVSFSPDMIHWGNHKTIEIVPQTWMREKWGIGPSPIKTAEGWLAIIHGVWLACNYVYRIGVILLDYEKPWKVIGQCPEFILTPRENYERSGETIDCVFCNGAIPESDGSIKIYYGAADTCICLATARIVDLIDACLNGVKP